MKILSWRVSSYSRILKEKPIGSKTLGSVLENMGIEVVCIQSTNLSEMPDLKFSEMTPCVHEVHSLAERSGSNKGLMVASLYPIEVLYEMPGCILVCRIAGVIIVNAIAPRGKLLYARKYFYRDLKSVIDNLPNVMLCLDSASVWHELDHYVGAHPQSSPANTYDMRMLSRFLSESNLVDSWRESNPEKRKFTMMINDHQGYRFNLPLTKGNLWTTVVYLAWRGEHLPAVITIANHCVV